MTLPCIICKKKLENVIDKDPDEPDGPNYPLDALCFTSYGHYGTTVFDPMDGSFLEINICDDCIRNNGNRGEILLYQEKLFDPIREISTWRP